MGYAIEVGDPTAAKAPASPAPFAVVATMGESDEESVIAAIAARPAYLAVVASRKRFAQLRETLLARSVPAEALDRIKNPAGLDIGARLPEEVALSILAEIVQLRRAQGAEAQPVAPEATEIDPICGMTVEVASARHRATHAGRDFYFCNARCRERFLADPGRWLAPRVAEGAR
jgi:xanthine dehydrogenase accessory factor